MPYIIYKRARGSVYDYEWLGVCSKKNLEKILARLKGEREETPKIADLRRQKNYSLQKIEKLRESKFKIDRDKYDKAITSEIRKLENVANQNLEKEISTIQSRISNLEKEIESEKNNIEYIFEYIKVLKE